MTGKLEDLETWMEDLLNEWTNTLLNTISDPIVVSQMEYLSPQQKAATDHFTASKTLLDKVDVDFINSVKALLPGFEPVVIEPEGLIGKLDAMGPTDVSTFKNRFLSIVDAYTKGKDVGGLQIIVKKP